MKTTLVLLMILSGLAQAETVLSERVVSVSVDVSTAKVRLSSAGYTSPVVKVLVPDLADVTVLDHRNPGEAAPCLATYDTLEPADVVAGQPGIETALMTIRLTKSALPDPSAGVCRVYLNESINGVLRGFHFTHDRTFEVSPRVLDDCR